MEDLQRKGEDRYLEKKIDALDDANEELFKLANDALALARIEDVKGGSFIEEEYRNLDANIRLVIALSSPYLDKDKKENVDTLYNLLTSLRLMLNNEIDGEKEDIITHLYWLNENILLCNIA